MFEPLRKLLLAGLGTIDLTEEKARAVFDDLVARGELSDKEARELVSGFARRAGEQRDRLQRQIEEAVRRTLDSIGVATRTDLERLSARISDLERRLGQTPGEDPTGS
jgi:polyhydroxyalkanoate synthesis regulator phasin